MAWTLLFGGKAGGSLSRFQEPTSTFYHIMGTQAASQIPIEANQSGRGGGGAKASHGKQPQKQAESGFWTLVYKGTSLQSCMM